MNPRLKNILAVVAGVVAGSLVIGVVEKLTAEKVPEGLDFNNKEVMVEYIKNLPARAFAFLLVAYFLGSVAAGYVANLIARSTGKKPALTAGLILFLAGVMNLVAIPHPMWFAITSSLVYFAGAWIGGRLVAPHTTH